MRYEKHHSRFLSTSECRWDHSGGHSNADRTGDLEGSSKEKLLLGYPHRPHADTGVDIGPSTTKVRGDVGLLDGLSTSDCRGDHSVGHSNTERTGDIDGSSNQNLLGYRHGSAANTGVDIGPSTMNIRADVGPETRNLTGHDFGPSGGTKLSGDSEHLSTHCDGGLKDSTPIDRNNEKCFGDDGKTDSESSVSNHQGGNLEDSTTSKRGHFGTSTSNKKCNLDSSVMKNRGEFQGANTDRRCNSEYLSGDGKGDLITGSTTDATGYFKRSSAAVRYDFEHSTSNKSHQFEHSTNEGKETLDGLSTSNCRGDHSGWRSNKDCRGDMDDSSNQNLLGYPHGSAANNGVHIGPSTMNIIADVVRPETRNLTGQDFGPSGTKLSGDSSSVTKNRGHLLDSNTDRRCHSEYLSGDGKGDSEGSTTDATGYFKRSSAAVRYDFEDSTSNNRHRFQHSTNEGKETLDGLSTSDCRGDHSGGHSNKYSTGDIDGSSNENLLMGYPHRSAANTGVHVGPSAMNIRGDVRPEPRNLRADAFGDSGRNVRGHSYANVRRHAGHVTMNAEENFLHSTTNLRRNLTTNHQYDFETDCNKDICQFQTNGKEAFSTDNRDDFDESIIEIDDSSASSGSVWHSEMDESDTDSVVICDNHEITSSQKELLNELKDLGAKVCLTKDIDESTCVMTSK